jgi:hypothetical protein
MTDTADGPRTGLITIEWQVASDPTDATTYSWQIRAEPPLPDDIVAALLRDISSVY